MIGWPTGRETDAAIADDDRGHAMDGGRQQPLLPDDLAIIMGVNVDETRRDDQPRRVNFLAAALDLVAYLYDEAILDADVGDAALAAQTVEYRAAPDHQIHQTNPPASLLK